jgi:hypothetical protein
VKVLNCGALDIHISLYGLMSRLDSYDVETGIALITEAGASLKVDTQLLRDVALRQGSLYQFIGELNFTASNEVISQTQITNWNFVSHYLYTAL